MAVMITPKALRWAYLHGMLTGMLACPWDEDYRHDCGCDDFDPMDPASVVKLVNVEPEAAKKRR